MSLIQGRKMHNIGLAQRPVRTTTEISGADLAARITEYKGTLAIELLKFKSEEGKLTLSFDHPGYVGQVIHGTKQLGVSKEALAAMARLPKGHDDLGEINCYRASDGVMRFSWLGGNKKLFNCMTAVAGDMDRTWTAPTADQVTVIPNDFPEEAKKIVDER